MEFNYLFICLYHSLQNQIFKRKFREVDENESIIAEKIFMIFYVSNI